MSHRSLFVIALVITAYVCCGQQFEAVYGFPNVTTSSGSIAPSPVPTVPGLTCGTFSAFGTSPNPNASGRFSFTGWPVGAPDGSDNYATYTAALSPFSYYEFCLTPQTGFTLNLSGLSFSVRRSGTGVRNYCVRASSDGFSTNLAAITGTSTNLEVIPNDIFFWKYDNTSTSSDQWGSDVVFDNSFSKISSPLFIRFYAWNSEAVGGSFSIDNVTIKGEMIDSLLLAGIKEDVPPGCKIFADGDLIVNECNSDEIKLFSVEGKMIRQWMDPPKQISTTDIDPGIYIVLIRSGKTQYRQKMLLHR